MFAFRVLYQKANTPLFYNITMLFASISERIYDIMRKLREKSLFFGAATAVATPFFGGEIDYHALGNIIENQISSGVSALVFAGTTGEAPTLSDKEKSELFSFAVERVGGRVPVIAGTGSPSTEKMLYLSHAARDAGADGLLIVTPYYNKGTEEGIVKSYQLAADIGLPVIVYNVPSRSGIDLSHRLIARLSKIEGIVGLKEANPNIEKLASLCADKEIDLDIYTGCDSEILPAVALGACGVISVVSNILPRETALLCSYIEEGKIKKARELANILNPLIDLLFREASPAPAKHLMAHLGMCREEMRLPLSEVSRELGDKLTECFNSTAKALFGNFC